MECGADEFELDHYLTHEYTEFEAYFGQPVILCDFCVADFASYDPAYFGFSKGRKISSSDWTFVRRIIDIQLAPQHYCPNCSHLLSFMTFVEGCRQGNERGDSEARP